MNNKTIYQNLQHHYQKLTARLAKAKARQRSQSVQHQLIGRLQRCSMQLKQLSAGVAVVAALGWSSPARAQVTLPFPLLERTGISNPLDSVEAQMLHSPVFVDMDGDGDKDMFIVNTKSNYTSDVKYFENTGSIIQSNYTERPIGDIFYPSASNSNPGKGVVFLDFVDMDADGDMDAFYSNGDYFSGFVGLKFCKNVGTTTNPILQQQASNNNPMDIFLADTNLGIPNAHANRLVAAPSFVDIDADGDMDLFVTFCNSTYYGNYAMNEDVWYYENTGNATTPTFTRRQGANNPFSLVPDSTVLQGKIEFHDMDQDGDMDAILTRRNNGNAYTPNPYYENVGTATVPAFVLSASSPLATIDTNALSTVTLIDIDNDGDTDVFRTYSVPAAPVATGKVYFYENIQYVGITQLPIRTALEVYPNPSTGLVQLSEALTGQLSVYTATGKLVAQRSLEQQQAINLGELPAGVYTLQVVTDSERWVQQVTLMK